MTYTWFLDVFPNLLVDALPLVLLLVGYLRWRRSDGVYHRRMLWMSAGVLPFCLLDFALLKALPKLGLSFGPPDVPLAVLWVLRAGLLLAWMYLPLPIRTGRIALITTQVLLTAALLYSFYYEPFHVTTTRIELPAPGLQPGRRVRIVQLTDLHIERTGPRERKVAEIVRAAAPDLIVLTGDYLSTSYKLDPQSVLELRALVSELPAPYGIYAVNGSVESPERFDELFRGTDVVLLINAARVVDTPAGPLALIGITDMYHDRDARALKRVAAEAPAGLYSILLYHNPDLIEAAARSGIDLYFAGHTHGGQIRIPFYGAVIDFSIYGKKYEQGLFEYQGTHMYVSRGLGMEGKAAPRARFLAPPEVVIMDLVGQ